MRGEKKWGGGYGGGWGGGGGGGKMWKEGI